MSVSLLLVPAVLAGLPLALGAAADISDRITDKAAPVRVQTRMKDIRLLSDALVETGGRVSDVGDHRLTVAWPGFRAEFTRDGDGIWAAHFDGSGVNAAAAAELLQVIDSAYARRVQQALVHRLKERAAGAGLQLQSEAVEEDNTVTLVLNVRS